MLIAKNVSLYKKRPILQDVSLTFSIGSISLLLGTSGAGKSSLLRCLAQLEADYEGEISFEGANLRQLPSGRRASCLSYIAQSYALFPHLTVLKNCCQPLQVVQGKSFPVAKEHVMEILTSLNMEAYISSYPSELSGGQKQRIAIARALALNPDVLLLDEPTSALDTQNSDQLIRILLNLAAKGKTIVIASQDSYLIAQLSAHVYLVENGKVEKIASENWSARNAS